MSSTSVSLLVPEGSGSNELAPARETLVRYLESTGLEFEILGVDAAADETPGAALRRRVAEATGEVVVIVDSDLPYDISAIGDAVALVQSAGAEVVFTTAELNGVRVESPSAIARWLLVPSPPDGAIALKAFSLDAAKLILTEAKLHGGGCDLEIAYLANKYGFRIERLRVPLREAPRPRPDRCNPAAAALRIRLIDRRMGYRAARRCPVCFSSDVWSRGQIGGTVVRACSRCKCRYLNRFVTDEGTPMKARVLRAQPPAGDIAADANSDKARSKTSQRRLSAIREYLAPHARILEVGVRDASFGLAAARDYEYVGIDRAGSAARHARALGLEVYCASLSDFVNTGPAFDAITLFHVFENMADPHDGLSRLRDLLKPGGVLFLSAFDTESFVYLLSERKGMAQYFRTHLIVYSRSALIELLEHSGFEILTINPDFEYRDHPFLRHWIASRHPALRSMAGAILKVLPDPLLVSSGSIRVMAKRRAGPPVDVRTVRSVEPMHAG